MKKVLVIQYTQTGQLTEVLKHFCAPLFEDAQVEVTVETLRPEQAFPYPWPFFRFFDTFPETVYLDAGPLKPLSVDPARRFDLVILGYQAWFLSPSLPVTAFLQSEAARSLLKDTPVVTVVACRDMWLMAQEQVKRFLGLFGARLVGHVALVDEAGTVGSFLATPLWLLSGKKGPKLGGLIPRAGVAPEKIMASRRFGERIAQVLGSGAALDESLLKGLGAVEVKENLIATERTARRSFLVWGGLLRALGRQGSPQRQVVLVVYVAFLVTLLATFLPLSVLVKKMLAPLMRKRIAAQVEYFGKPSGA